MSTNTTILPTTSTPLPVPVTPSTSSTTSLPQPSSSAPATTSPATTPVPLTTSSTAAPPTTTSPTTTSPTTTPTPTTTTTPTTTPPTTSTSITTPQPPVTSVESLVITTTVSPTNESQQTVTQTITSTNVTPGLDTSATSASSVPNTPTTPTNSSVTEQPTNTLLGSSNGSSSAGLNGTAKVVVAVIVPIVGVAFVAILLLFLWKRRQKTRADAEARRKEVEEYGYNPNNDPHGGAAAAAGVGVARSSSNGEETLYEMTESDGAGYRGWGSTNGGRKASNMGSSVGTSVPMSPVGMAFSDSGFPQQQQGNNIGSSPDGYTNVATSPSASTFPVANSPSVDGNSNAPLIHGNRPATADSSVIGAMNGPSTAENSGIHRGISNASSNYSAMTQSDQSDVGQPLSHHDAQYYGVDDGYEDAYYSSRNPASPYSGDNGYGPAPVIRDVSARRNTRIETPTSTHFPQQGNSGIAQNF